ncbi:MAG: FAD-binding oxidoreductase [Actinomycetia bacterium]|jgi:FAD/FMN-containing dehydrogenase|nr:FAD-binding oxidoreductase [Actinomycetes bacterium]
MRTLTSADPEYDEARALFNRSIDKHPAVIAMCDSPHDVVEALGVARDRNLDIAVRAGGHSVAGLSTNDGGLVIDVRPMNDVTIDPGQRTAQVGAGVTWGDFDAAAQEHGLAVTGGRATSTGVAGFTLGGGDGWLSRALGLACDNLLSVDLVTADGRQIHASESSHPDLFWALHGGGGNFGVATSFQFRLHPIGPTVLAGLLAWPLEDARDVARAYRDLVRHAPNALGSALVILTGPPEEFMPAHLVGRPLLAVAVCYAGEVDEGADVLRPLVGMDPAVNLIGPMPYTEFQIMLTDPPGFHHYWSADYHDTFDDQAMDIFLRAGANRTSPLTQQLLAAWGGAITDVPDGATPLSHRSTRWVSHPFAVWDNPADAPANIAWVRDFRRDIAPHTNGGVYLNFIGAEGQDRVRAAFGDTNYRRLASVKATYDPRNTFRGNQNIHPA